MEELQEYKNRKNRRTTKFKEQPGLNNGKDGKTTKMKEQQE